MKAKRLEVDVDIMVIKLFASNYSRYLTFDSQTFSILIKSDYIFCYKLFRINIKYIRTIKNKKTRHVSEDVY